LGENCIYSSADFHRLFCICLFLLTTEYTKYTEVVNSNGIQLQG
jgi:hypothetical protein